MGLGSSRHGRGRASGNGGAGATGAAAVTAAGAGATTGLRQQSTTASSGNLSAAAAPRLPEASQFEMHLRRMYTETRERNLAAPPCWLGRLPRELFDELMKYVSIMRWSDGSSMITVVRTMAAHTSSVKSVCFLDSERVASASFDNWAIIWQLSTGERLRSIMTSNSLWSICKYTPHVILTGGGNHKVEMWSTETGAKKREFAGHTNFINSIRLLPNDNQRFVSASSDSTLRLWDGESSQCIRVFRGHQTSVWDFIFVSDNEILSCPTDAQVIHWDIATGSRIKLFEVPQRLPGETVEFYAMATDGTTVWSGGYLNGIYSWKMNGGEFLGKTATSNVVGEILLLGGILMYACWDGNVYVMDKERNLVRRTLRGHTAGVRCMARQGNYLLTGADDHKVVLWHHN